MPRGFAIASLFAAVMALAGSAIAAPIPIVNPSFEADSGLVGCFSGEPTGWTPSASAGSCAQGSWNPLPSGNFPSGLPDGTGAAWLNAAGHLAQILPASLEADMVYTLSAFVGVRDGNGSGTISWALQLLADGVIVGEKTGNIVSTQQGQMIPVSVSYTSPATVPAGQMLEIRLAMTPANASPQLAFDRVSLDASPVISSSVQIPIVNPSFEADSGLVGCFSGEPTGWTPSASAGSCAQGSWNPLPSGNFPSGLPDGTGAAWLNAAGHLAQVLPDSLQPDTAYALSAYVGVRDGNGSSTISWALQFLADGAILAETTGDIMSTQQGQMTPISVSYTSPSTVPTGQLLEIRLVMTPENASPQLSFDLVELRADLATPQFTEVKVGDWQATWFDFFDDFEDGTFADGGVGEPTHYSVVCGTVNDTHESNGTLKLAGPEACGATQISTAFAIGSEATIRATFRFDLPTVDGGFGVSFGDGLDFASVSVFRSIVNGLDFLFVALGAEDALVRFDTISFQPAVDPALSNVAAIELELVVILDNGLPELVPTGRYRLCQSTPCESEATTPMRSIPTNAVPASADFGVLVSTLPHGVGPFAFGPVPFAVEVEEWSISQGAADDFSSAAFGDRHPYGVICGDVSQVDGKLTMTTGPCAAGKASFWGIIGSQPGELDTSATFDFVVPKACGSYGISPGTNSALFAEDFAHLSVMRMIGTSQIGGTDTLDVVLMAEPEGPTQSGVFGNLGPIIARSTISIDPGNDPALVDIVSVELAVELRESSPGGALSPTGLFRLCTSGGCPASFSELAPYSGTTATDEFLCGVNAQEFNPPNDGGVITSPNDIVVGIIHVPEPGTLMMLSAGIALLVVLQRERRRRA